MHLGNSRLTQVERGADFFHCQFFIIIEDDNKPLITIQTLRDHAHEVLALKPPASLLTNVELVRLSASTTIPATLLVAGKHFSLTRAPQQLEVPVKPGNGPAMIVMRLEANGMTNVSTLVIRRLAPGATPPLTHPMEPVRPRPTGN